eukprot:1435187-Rhodomonas_salina.1
MGFQARNLPLSSQGGCNQDGVFLWSELHPGSRTSALHKVQLREEARKAKTAFNDNPDTWMEASQVTELTKYFEDPENGKVVTGLSIVRSTVLKSAFGTMDVTNFKAAFYKSEDELKAAMTTAVEDYFTEKMK